MPLLLDSHNMHACARVDVCECVCVCVCVCARARVRARVCASCPFLLGSVYVYVLHIATPRFLAFTRWLRDG